MNKSDSDLINSCIASVLGVDADAAVSDSDMTSILTHMEGHVQKATVEWLRANATPEKIQKSVYTLLDGAREQIVTRLLGFSHRWDKWEIDHCNGRHTVLNDAIQESAKSTAHEWVEKALADAGELDAHMKEAIQREFKDSARRYAHEFARDYVSSVGSKLVERFKAEVVEKIEAVYPVKKSNKEDNCAAAEEEEDD